MKAKWWVCILTAISDQLSGIKISNAFKSDSIYSVQNFIIENFLIDVDRVQKQVWMEKKKYTQTFMEMDRIVFARALGISWFWGGLTGD